MRASSRGMRKLYRRKGGKMNLDAQLPQCREFALRRQDVRDDLVDLGGLEDLGKRPLAELRMVDQEDEPGAALSDDAFDLEGGQRRLEGPLAGKEPLRGHERDVDVEGFRRLFR